MANKIFINLPVRNLAKTNRFFAALGFAFNPQFSDEKVTCMVLNDHTCVMLLLNEFFAGFTPKPLSDAHRNTEVLVALSTESRARVDTLLEAAIAAGGTETRNALDHGFMYSRSFNDLDGHIWEVLWMDGNTEF